MWLKELHISNFRNIQDLTISFSQKSHFFIGLNGQGKTSILEAIGYLSSLQSFRGATIEEVVASNSKGTTQIRGIIEDPLASDLSSELLLQVTSSEEGGKFSQNFSINGKKLSSRHQYYLQRFQNPLLGLISVSFNPADQDLVRGSPQVRRDYLDDLISLWDPTYLRALKQYNRALRQRNAFLKDKLRSSRNSNSIGQEGFQSSRALELSINEPFVQYGVYIASQRLQWLISIRSFLQKNLDSIFGTHSGKYRKVEARYFSSWVPFFEGLIDPQKRLKIPDFSGLIGPPSLENLERAFWQRLEELRSAEYHQGVTLVGPHRDDWGTYLDNHLVQSFGSQGEVRSVVLALKLSEIELIQNRTGRKPLFLLDDLSSELDRDRRTFLLSALEELQLQVFVTSTEKLTNKQKEAESYFHVSAGALQLGRFT